MSETRTRTADGETEAQAIAAARVVGAYLDVRAAGSSDPTPTHRQAVAAVRTMKAFTRQVSRMRAAKAA
jgi:hypothetical protein